MRRAEAAGASPAIELRALSRRFGDRVAVDALTLAVPPGSLYGLVGPDGAGKTTTLRMLAGVLRPTGGDALVGGTSVAADPERAKRHTAYMAQRFGLYADLTVRENIDFYADLYGVPRTERPARLEELFGFSGLGPFQGRLAGQLSGGMKQKLALCACLIHRPAILLLDEPTFGVDPISRRELWLLLHRMVQDGLTVLVSTAYLDEAERCDRVGLLHAGRLLADAPPSELQAQLPGRMYEVRAADSRRAAAVLEPLAGVRRVALYGEMVHVLAEDGAGASPAALAAALAEAGVAAEPPRAIAPSLEDVFIERLAGPA